MKLKIAAGSLLLAMALIALPGGIWAAQPAGHVSGEYIESRTADVFTGPCFANSEVNLTGQEAVLAWHIEKGTWGDVPLDGLSVAAVVRASATLGDPFSDPLPAKAVLIVDQPANAAQRAALVSFAQSQSGKLLSNVVAIEALPIRFAVDGSRHGYASLEVGDVARITTRAIREHVERVEPPERVRRNVCALNPARSKNDLDAKEFAERTSLFALCRSVATMPTLRESPELPKKARVPR